MKINYQKYLPLFIFALIPLLSGCSLSFASSGSKIINASDGGVYMSDTKGDSWTQVSLVPTVDGSIRTIGREDIQDIAMDPNDHGFLYLAIPKKGLWYTNNIVNGWNQVDSLGNTDIRVVRVDPENKCIVYVLSENRILKTINCGRDFKEIYQDDIKNTALTAIAIDWRNHNNIYLGNSRGEIIKSIDGGNNWRLIKKIDSNSSIDKLLISPQDSQKIFVATKSTGIYSFISNTRTNPSNSEEVEANFAVNNWQDYNSVLKSIDVGSEFRGLTVSDAGVLFLATRTTLARSVDSGITWEKLNILNADGSETSINAVAVNQSNPSEIYFVTDNTLFRSFDNGISWSSKKLPSTRSGSVLLVDYQNSSKIYLGMFNK